MSTNINLNKPPLTEEENASFDRLEAQVKVCTKCDLSKTRIQAVPGHGSRVADIMFIGEGPGKSEDEKGLPFVGAAGKFLDKLLESINLRREDVYITNVVKCRPPNNREPRPDEIQACNPYLREQIQIIKPKIICTLGNSAARTLIKPDINISAYHGRFFRKDDHVYCLLYHPAAALYNGSLKSTLEEDFERLGKFLERAAKGIRNDVESE